MKRIILTIWAVLLISVTLSAQHSDTLKLLTIGNSFSDDAVEQHLYGLFEAVGKPVVIANAYIPGCSLERHNSNAKSGKAEYSFRKIVNGKKTVKENISLDTILQNDDWDYVSFQQASAFSGIYDSFQPHLRELITYVRGYCKDSKLVWHETWAYDSDSWHDAFPSYGCNQMTMYKAIKNCTKQADNEHHFDLIIPNGTAVQNARTTALKHRLTRDTYHMSYNYGRYLTSCTWFEALTGTCVVGNSYKPEALITKEALICQQAAHQAILNPGKITKIKSKYKEVSDYTVSKGKLLHKGQPYYYIGTNIWYAADLYSIDKPRLYKELDALKSMGITNLRILAADADIESLKKLLDAMDERGMMAVLYLNNSWEWSETGYRSFLKEAGAGEQPIPANDGYHAYIEAMSEFASNEKALELFYDKVKHVVYQLKNYPAVFAWQICNEPRPFSTDKKKVDDFVKYIETTSKLIKSIDPIHLVSIGSEGLIGCNGDDVALLRRIHKIQSVDYMTIHIWPYNWSWVNEQNLESNLDVAIAKTEEYICHHIKVAKKLSKPVVIEEFGYPRDGFAYENSSTTSARDKYYSFVFTKVIESSRGGGILAGCNFWAWNGFARQTPGHQLWQSGDDLCGDPKHEAQGLYGVYLKDSSSVEVIKDAIRRLSE